MSCCNSNCNHDPCGSSFNQSLTRAAQYAQYAQTQANKSEDLWLEFNALYLGAFAVSPTQDNEGNPLQEGALYFNSASNEMFVWQGGSWIDFDFDEFTPFLATGTTTARNLATRFADVINVKDFGAVGNGVADDTAAIEAAINSISTSFAALPKSIYFPNGKYIISRQLWVKSYNTGFTCDSFNSAIIQLTNFSAESAILVKSPFANTSLGGFSWQNVGLNRGASSTYQIGIILEACDNTHMLDAEISGFPTCLDIRGGRNCHYTTLRLGDFGSTNTTPDTGLLQMDASSYLTNPTSFTHIFTNSMIAGGQYCLRIKGIDYITFSNTYFGGGKQGDVLIAEGTIYANYDNYFDNCYFDFAQSNYDVTRAAFTITGGNKNTTKITDCRFGPWGIGVKIDSGYDPSIQITGCLFMRTNTPVLMTSISNATSLVLTGNQFRDSTFITNNTSCLQIQDASQLTITGNAFIWDYAGWDAFGQLPGTKKVISVTAGATIENITITGNVFNSFSFGGVTFVDFENLGTVDQLVITGNASNNATNTLVGNVTGNQSSTNPLMLDWYQESTFTPVLTFGGGSTGLTIGTNRGNYTRIGNRVLFDIYIDFSNKGSSTGDFLITGLPFPLAPSAVAVANASVSIQKIDGIGTANVDAVFPTSNTIKFVYINGTGDPVNLTNANFRNNTQFWVSGTYQVA